jgi:hypothetical protein
MDLQKMLTEYRDAMNEIKPMLDSLEAMKLAIRDKAMELGESMEIEGAKVELRDGYERPSWDGKKLEGLALVHPEINQCKKMITVKPTAAVTVK